MVIPHSYGKHCPNSNAGAPVSPPVAGEPPGNALLCPDRTDCEDVNNDALLMSGYLCHPCLPNICGDGEACYNIPYEGVTCGSTALTTDSPSSAPVAVPEPVIVFVSSALALNIEEAAARAIAPAIQAGIASVIGVPVDAVAIIQYSAIGTSGRRLDGLLRRLESRSIRVHFTITTFGTEIDDVTMKLTQAVQDSAPLLSAVQEEISAQRLETQLEGFGVSSTALAVQVDPPVVLSTAPVADEVGSQPHSENVSDSLSSGSPTPEEGNDGRESIAPDRGSSFTAEELTSNAASSGIKQKEKEIKHYLFLVTGGVAAFVAMFVCASLPALCNGSLVKSKQESTVETRRRGERTVEADDEEKAQAKFAKNQVASADGGSTGSCSDCCSRRSSDSWPSIFSWQSSKSWGNKS
jgi:hypothetical protein